MSLLFLLLGLQAVPGLLFSQERLFDARLLTREEGLANLMTRTVFKDRQGFLWVATDSGLSRYDGHAFRLYTKEKNALYKNDLVSRIGTDGAQRLWLFYKAAPHTVVPNSDPLLAVDIFDLKTERAVPFDKYFGGKAPFKMADIILPQIIDAKKRLWVATRNGELFRCDEGIFKKIWHGKGIVFQCVAIDSADNIRVATRNKLLWLDQSGKVLAEQLLPGEICAVNLGSHDDVWVSVANGPKVDIWHCTKDGASTPFTFSRAGQALPLKTETYFAHRSPKGYWYTVMDGQLSAFDAGGRWLFNFHTLVGKDLTTQFFNGVEDERYMWFATPVGVLQTTIRENRFQLIHHQDKGYSDCRGIAEDAAGNICFINRYVFQWDKKTKTCKKVSKGHAAFGLICLDSMLWSGDYSHTTLGFEMDFKTLSERQYPVLNDSQYLAFALIKSDKPGRLLAGLNKGLTYVDLKTKQLIPFEKYNGFEVLKSSEVNFFHKNTVGIWLATNNGVFLMQETEGVVRQFDMATGDLPFNNIRHICEDKEGVFWLATKGGGVLRWHPALHGQQPGKCRQFTIAEGLSDNATYAVYEDDYGKLWIPSDKGLMCMDKATLRIRVFLQEDGLLHNEFNHTAHHQAKDGTLYFGGLGGLIALNPADFAEKTDSKVPLEFSACYVLESGSDEMTDKTEALQTSRAITMRPGDKFLEFHFNLLDFDNPARHRYAYQIKGYSDNWNQLEGSFIRITNLPYGRYTLKIQGRHSSEGWSEEELSVALLILRPFYLQGWFIWAVIAGTGGLLFWGARWRTSRLRKEKEYLEAEVQKRTQQVERDKQTIAAQAEALQTLDKAKTRFFANITHEFRTPLTLIIGPTEQLAANADLDPPLRKTLSGVLKNARQLLHFINQLLDLSKLESGQMPTTMTHDDIVGHTRELMSRFGPLADRNKQTWRFESGETRWETHFDKGAWDKIVYNLLSNAAKFTPNGGSVTLRLDKVEDGPDHYVHLVVADTGIGIAPADIGHIFDRFYQADSPHARAAGGTGIGLAFVKELVEHQGGSIRVSSTAGKGSIFDIRLPLPKPEALHQPVPESIDASELLFLDEAESSGATTRLAQTLQPAHGPEGRLKLLLIEDNEDMRSYIRQCMDETQYQIIEATDGEEGILLAQKTVPDLIVSDVMMPGKDGFEVVQEIRGQTGTSHIPIVLLTARTSIESRLQGLERGADAYLTKPFSPRELALQIQNLITIRQHLRTRYQGGQMPEDAPVFQKEDAFIAELNTYIRNNLSERGLHVEGLSRHFGISRTQFYRKLDALLARPIGDHIRSIRLETAAELLRERQLSISEVAYATGFSSPSHFARAFKKAYGKTPSEMQ